MSNEQFMIEESKGAMYLMEDFAIEGSISSQPQLCDAFKSPANLIISVGFVGAMTIDWRTELFRKESNDLFTGPILLANSEPIVEKNVLNESAISLREEIQWPSFEQNELTKSHGLLLLIKDLINAQVFFRLP